jgi:formate dehydrogenase (NADP+) alpha subunit
MNMINLKINGKKLTVPQGTTILDAARLNDIYIPTLCDDPRLEPYGGCRLCIVNIEGIPKAATACTTPVSEGMKIETSTPEIEQQRRTIVELLLSDHPNDCMVCERAGDCTLQELAYFYDLRTNRFEGEKRQYTKKDLNPFIEREMEKCILCSKCTRVCTQVQGVSAIDVAGRGFASFVSPPFKKDLNCEFCGQCVSVCPTGALVGKEGLGKGRHKGVREIDTICPYCGCGCGITLHVIRNEVVRVSSRMDTLNEGWLCVKGRFGYGFINSPDRLKTPLIKKDGVFVKASWDEALDHIADKLGAIKQQYGPDAIAGLASARCTNEENYLFQKFMRAAVGTNNIDHCARNCHSTTVAGLATVFGSGAMTNSIQEVENNDVIFVIGSNTKENHPIIALKMIKAKRKGAKIIIADPRRVPMVRHADIWMQHRPGTDVALLNAMTHVIIKEGLINRNFIDEQTEDYNEEFIRGLEEYTPEAAEKITGVPRDLIIKSARMYASSPRAGLYYAMGITQHACGTNNVFAVANLALITGNLGKENAGVNPLRGQNNVQGACDMGCLPGVYPGYQRVNIPSVQQKFEALWKVKLPDKEGLTAPDMLSAALQGSLKALYIMGENPVISDPDMAHTKKALKALDFLVVQDIFMTETAELADVVLPGAVFAEKIGTVTNTERRVQLMRAAVNPPGKAMRDSNIIINLSRKMGYNMPYHHTVEIFRELGQEWSALAGMSYARVGEGGLQWPCPTMDHPGAQFLFKGGFPRGKGRFTLVHYKPAVEGTDKDYPLVLTTGRQLFQYHTGSMTRRVKPINEISPECYVEINTDDAKALAIEDGSQVKVISRRGSISVKAVISKRTAKGVVFVPFHFREAAANSLTSSVSLDPVAKIPSFKVSAVRIEKIA